MAATALVVENILIGCFTWAWIAAFLFRFDFLAIDEVRTYASLLKDHTAAIAFAGVLLVYPVGAMMNSVCFVLASKLFEKRINETLGITDFNEIYIYVLGHGSKELVEALQSFIVPVMRLSRAVALNFLILGLVLFSWFSNQLLPYAFICICIAALGFVAFYYSAKEWKSEFKAAYRMFNSDRSKA